jgi:hypothetical protein
MRGMRSMRGVRGMRGMRITRINISFTGVAYLQDDFIFSFN